MILINRIKKGLGVLAAIAFGLRSGFRNRPVVLVDIGGRGGLSKSWHFLWGAGLVKPVFFEPDPAAASQLVTRFEPSAIVIQKAAWSVGKTKTLNITAEPGSSSILAPMPDPRMPESIKKMLRVTKQFTVGAVRAETVLTNLGIIPEIVKIDIQGGELEALKGFG